MSFSSDTAAPIPPPDSWAREWKKVDALLAKNQTATAAPLVDALYQRARQQQNTPAYVRALLYKIRLLENREEDSDEKAIALLEKDLKTAAFPARPILHSLLGELYTQYLNRNRYRIYQRTAGAQATADSTATADAGTALPTWDIGRLGAAIVRHYYQSVEDEPQRQLKITLAQLGGLVVGGDAEGRALRPTLYDLLAHRAISGLQNQELYLTRPEQQFELTDPKLYGTAAEFAALRLLGPEADSLNGQLHALHILQRLTASRLGLADNLAAVADVDLTRIEYLYGLTQGTELAAHYVPALVRSAKAYGALPISTEFIARHAELLKGSSPAEAIKLAREAEARFPNARGTRRARRVREEIEQPQLGFSAADIVTAGQPWWLSVGAKNVRQVHAWAYRITLNEWRSFHDYQQRANKAFDQRYARALKAGPVAAWQVPLEATPGGMAAPPLPAGYYLLMLSNQTEKPTVPRPGGVTSYAVLGVSQLTALSRRDPATGAQQLLVLDRHSGELLPGVRVQASLVSYDEEKRKEVTRLGEVRETAATGEVTLLPPTTGPGYPHQYPGSIKVWRGSDTLLLATGYHEPYRDYGPQTYRHTFLFADRAIYRPGQTLYFKGILTETTDGKSRLLPSQAATVRLVDANGQTVQTLPFTTSDFGSFHGSLVLPTGLLNGQMSLQTESGNLGFLVEDYKRPTFAVTIEPVPELTAPDKAVRIRGRAQAYAGQPIGGVAVRYRVLRQEQWLHYGGYHQGGYGRPGGQEVAHGQVETDNEGNFTIDVAPPPLGRAGGGRWRPGHYYQVTADVTDASGETRTGTQVIYFGPAPVSLRLEGPSQADKQRLPGFRLLATSFTGKAEAVAGTLRILNVSGPARAAGLPLPPAEYESNEEQLRLVKTLPFKTTEAGDITGLATALAALPTGRYRLEAVAARADSARAQLGFVLYDSQAATIPFATPDWFVSLQDTVAPGQPASLLLGSQHAGARILLEVESDGKLLRREWITLAANEQRRISIAPSPAGNSAPLVVHTTQVRHNRLYRHDATVQVVEKPQPLTVDISTFRDRLRPGQRETWRFTIRQANGQPAAAELVATLYDQSLDEFQAHQFTPLHFGGRGYPTLYGWNGAFGLLQSRQLFLNQISAYPPEVSYPRLWTWTDSYARQMRAARGGLLRATMASQDMQLESMEAKASAPMAPGAGNAVTVRASTDAAAEMREQAADGRGAAPPDLTGVIARKDFRETAFWQPALRTDKDGNIVLEFDLPEAVTRWQLFALAHDQQLHTGQLARRLVTQKEMQVTPNAPRFFRQGDQLTLSAKVSNLTDGKLNGTAQLFLLDAATGRDITGQLLKGAAQQPLSIAARQNAALGWDISLPADFLPAAVTYRIVAQSQAANATEPLTDKKSQRRAAKNQKPGPTFSDGEENTLPVLPNRLLVTESLPLPIVGPATREFELKKLTSTRSDTRLNHSLTLEMTPSPAWYAVQSLPYLMENPYESAEQVFNHLYANQVAAYILRSNPRFQAIIAEWQRQAQTGTAAQKNALESKLAQNQELKNLLLQETPWVRDAQSETERLARLSELFDQPRLAAETARLVAKLQKMQLPNGAFPWYEGMPEDRYITQLIVVGFGKLRQLKAYNASLTMRGAGDMLSRSTRYLDLELLKDYQLLRQRKGVKLADNHLTDLQVQALYARSFWPRVPLPAEGEHRTQDYADAYAYFRQQAAAYWPVQTRYLQAQLALALFRHDAAAPAARDIMRGLSENALHSPELGMYWKEVRGGYYWREAPTETQATLIEAYHEIKQDQKSVDEMKLWLLKHKQTHSWQSTRATADACYALLLRGSDWLAPAQPMKITIGAEALKETAAQAGTGYIKTSWTAAEVKAAQGKVRIIKPDAGVAWGALHWQYFEDLDKITPAATPLSLERQLYRETRTAGGPVLERISATTPLKVGEALVVRVVLRTDRELEYVHLKDQRAAGLEPIAQTSGYRYQNGLGYYESPRDAATNFFLSAVPRGTHVFEYRLRAFQAGNFSGGLSQVQCLYAPEFAAHSAGLRIEIAR